MSAQVSSFPSPRPPSRSDRIKAIFAALAMGFPDRTDMPALARLNRRELEDIGITRSDMYQVRPNRVQRPFV